MYILHTPLFLQIQEEKVPFTNYLTSIHTHTYLFSSFLFFSSTCVLTLLANRPTKDYFIINILLYYSAHLKNEHTNFFITTQIFLYYFLLYNSKTVLCSVMYL